MPFPANQPRRNIELKARLDSLEAARLLADEIATGREGVQRQVDTYFHCANGRLKLRQIRGLGAQLVWYSRPDEPRPKASDYRLVPVANPEELKSALASALGVLAVVEKRREIFLWQNVRIHLDQVVGLGEFLELEAVLAPGMDDAAGRAQLELLGVRFGLDPAGLVARSYSDLSGA